MNTPFGWWIEAGELRWFTREEQRMKVWRGKAKIVALGVIDESYEACEVEIQPRKPECEHEPDVLNRCVKCGADLSINAMTNG